MAGRDGPLRVLAILGGATPDSILGTETDQESPVGPLQELASLPCDVAEVKVLRAESLGVLAAHAQAWRPHIVYLHGGTPGHRGDIETQAVAPLACLQDKQGELREGLASDLLSALAGLQLETLVLDVAGSAEMAAALHQAAAVAGCGVAAARHVIAWPADPPVLPALDFARCFFGLLRQRGVTVPEAHAMACHMVKAHGTVAAPIAAPRGGGTDVPPPTAAEPPVPHLLPLAAGGGPDGEEPAAAAAPVLPGLASVAALALEGVDLSQGMTAAFPGYGDLRLLAPTAELRLLHAGVSPMVNATNLRYLGEALRALLTLETRGAHVAALTPCDHAPPQLPRGAGAVRCDVRTPGGAQVSVTLGGPADLLQNKELVQHALRQALTADAQTLQFKLAPPGLPPPPTHVSAGVAAGAPVVEGLAVTSVWTVQLLKLLAQEPEYRGLALLGVAAVSTSPVAAFGPADAARLTAVVTHNDITTAQAHPAVEPQPAPAAAAAASQPAPPASPLPGLAHQVSAANGMGGLTPVGSNAAADAAAAAVALPMPGSGPSPMDSLDPAPGLGGGPLEPADAAAHAALLQRQQHQVLEQRALMEAQAAAAAVAGGVLPWKSGRPAMSGCSEDAFYADLIAFLTDRQGRQIDPRAFPEAVLNGSRLDLYHLYKEVTRRGGYKIGNGINWKGQVFPRMRNFTINHKMTGVGNALKRHYQVFLLEYEQAHPEDIRGDRCALCGCGDEASTDWVSCDGCDTWVHFSCDTRQGRGAFKEYARGQGRLYHCPRCSEVYRQQALQAAGPQAFALAQLVEAATADAGEGVKQEQRQQAPQQEQQQEQQEEQQQEQQQAAMQQEQEQQQEQQPAAMQQDRAAPSPAAAEAAAALADALAPMQE